MDKAKGVLKNGWHPAGDQKLHRDSWKSDLKGMATGKTPEKKQLEASRSHQSAPLASLKDPDSFGPPPRHTGAVGSTPTTPTSPARARPPPGGLGGPVPKPRWKQEEEQVQAEPEAPKLPYRTNTTGLRTDNLPKPPARRDEIAFAPVPAPPPRTNSSASSLPPPARAQQPPPPPRSRPTPSLPPRMNEHPDEYTPPAPPAYHEATQPAVRDQPLLNQGAVNRLANAGVSVPGFGIQSNNDSSSNSAQESVQGHGAQLSELQQRFARLKTASDAHPAIASAVSSAGANAASAAVQKKPPPPPPPKKSGLANGSPPGTVADGNQPPPLPLSSKPRPP